MIKHERRGPNQLFIETKLGIVTRTGDWFHTTREQIEEFVPGLLDNYSLETLIGDAQGWVRSADALSLTFLLILLFYVNPWLAALAALSFHWFWYNYKSAFVNKYLSTLFGYMTSDGYLMIISLISLSFLGINEQYLAVGLGLFFFFLFKLGLLNRLWNKLIAGTSQKLSLNDRVLKMILLKYAIGEGLSPTSVQQIENKIAEMATRRKENKKN